MFLIVLLKQFCRRDAEGFSYFFFQCIYGWVTIFTSFYFYNSIKNIKIWQPKREFFVVARPPSFCFAELRAGRRTGQASLSAIWRIKIQRLDPKYIKADYGVKFLRKKFPSKGGQADFVRSLESAKNTLEKSRHFLLAPNAERNPNFFPRKSQIGRASCRERV